MKKITKILGTIADVAWGGLFVGAGCLLVIDGIDLIKRAV